MNLVTPILLMWFIIIQLTQPAQRIDQLLDKKVREYYNKREFNGAILVAKKGEVIFKKGYGYADINKKIRNDEHTKFSIGSTTKSFTAIAIIQQVIQGNLDLHTPISEYIPELNKKIGAITLHQLMKNISGLPVHLSRITTLEYRDITSDELIDLYNTIDLSFEPGSKFEYSNLNYQLCSIILERVSGMTYKEYLKQFVFDPVGMTQSGLERTHEFPADKAQGYDVRGEYLIKSERNYMGYAKGGGDMYSNLMDLFKWDQALYQDALVSKKGKALLFDGDPNIYDGYGYGFKIKQYQRNSTDKPQGKLVRHGGSMYGYSCNVHRYLDDQVTIIVLGNIRPYPVMEITLAIEKILNQEGYFE